MHDNLSDVASKTSSERHKPSEVAHETLRVRENFQLARTSPSPRVTKGRRCSKTARELGESSRKRHRKGARACNACVRCWSACGQATSSEAAGDR